MGSKLQKIALPESTNTKPTSAAAIKIGKGEDMPPKEGVFEEDGHSYKYFKSDVGKWEKRLVGNNGNPIGRKRKKIKKVQLSFSVDPDFKTNLEDYCQEIGRPLSQVVAEATKEYMKNNPI